MYENPGRGALLFAADTMPAPTPAQNSILLKIWKQIKGRSFVLRSS